MTTHYQSVQLTTEEILENFWQSQYAVANTAAKLPQQSPDAAQHGSSQGTTDHNSTSTQQSASHAAQTVSSSSSNCQKASSLPNARTNLLVQRLYRHKLDQLVANPATVLCKCSQCSTVFAALHRHKFPCSHESVAASVDAGLRVISSRHHVADKTWKAQR